MAFQVIDPPIIRTTPPTYLKIGTAPTVIQGIDGTDGTDGLDAYHTWLLIPGNEGLTITQWRADITGAPGTPGALPLVSSLPENITPSDSDVVLLEKSGVKYRWSWERMKASLKTYFDATYTPSVTIGDYYVSPTGLDTADGSLATPFLTITKALSVATAGDTVLVKAGTYNEYVRFLSSGADGRPITLQNYGTDIVTINAASINVYCIYAKNQSYITVKGIRAKDATNYIIMFEECHDIVLDGCYATYTTKQATKQCIVLDNGYNGITRYNNYLIKDCVTMNGDRGVAIWNNVSYATVKGGEHSYNNVNVAVGGGYPLNNATKPTYITIEGAKAHHSVTSNMGTENCQYVTFKNNYCYLGGSTGIQIETDSPDAIVEGNLCKDNSRTWEYETGIWVYNSPNAIVRGNWVKNNQTGLRFRSAANFQAYNNIIENNNYKPTSAPTTHNTSGADFYQSTGTFYHNTLIGNTAAESSLASIFVYAAGVCTITMKNNIIYNDGGSQDMVFEQAATSNCNLVYNAARTVNIVVGITGMTWAAYKTATGQDVNSVSSSPLLVSLLDFRLQSGSPAIGTGVNVGITADYLGNTRTTQDIGAYANIIIT